MYAIVTSALPAAGFRNICATEVVQFCAHLALKKPFLLGHDRKLQTYERKKRTKTRTAEKTINQLIACG